MTPAGHLTDEQAALYCEGTLPDAERQRIEIHLKDCAGCRSEVEDMQSAVKAFMQGDRHDLPPLPQRLVNEAVSRAQSQFDPALHQIATALWSKMQALRERLSRQIVPPLEPSEAIGLARQTEALNVISDRLDFAETGVTVHLAMSEQGATLAVEGDLQGAEVIGYTGGSDDEAAHSLGILGRSSTLSIPAHRLLALEGLALIRR